MSYQFNQQIIHNADGKIEFRRFRPGGRDHYQVKIWLEGDNDEIARVTAVDYQLHASFKQPARSSSNPDDNFAITIWTWGMFNIDAVIHLEDGTSTNQTFFLNYELPEDNGKNYIDLTPGDLESGQAT